MYDEPTHDKVYIMYTNDNYLFIDIRIYIAVRISVRPSFHASKTIWPSIQYLNSYYHLPTRRRWVYAYYAYYL